MNNVTGGEPDGEDSHGHGRDARLLESRPVMPHELKDLRRKLRGSLLQLEALMQRLDIPL